MRSNLRLSLFSLLGLIAGACASPRPPPPTTTSAPADLGTLAPSWPTAACTQRVNTLLTQMTLPEKLGQMVQAERKHLAKGDVAKYFLGSVLSGGGSYPGRGDAADWARMTDVFHAEARSTRLGIPLAYAVDAVHGHGNVTEATIFPHNIGPWLHARSAARPGDRARDGAGDRRHGRRLGLRAGDRRGA